MSRVQNSRQHGNPNLFNNDGVINNNDKQSIASMQSYNDHYRGRKCACLTSRHLGSLCHQVEKWSCFHLNSKVYATNKVDELIFHNNEKNFFGIMYSQFAVGPLLYLCCSSHVLLFCLYSTCCTSLALLKFIYSSSDFVLRTLSRSQDAP